MDNLITNSKIHAFDVVVCGAGPSGFAAAIESARNGLTVALIDSNGCFGGTMTNSAVCHLLGGRRWDASSERMIREVGGIFDEITDELIAEGSAVDPDEIDVHNNPFGWYPRMAAGIACDLEKLKIKLDEWITRYKEITPFLFSSVIGVDVQENHINKIFVYNHDGISSFKAKTYIDATGDAQLAYLCKCPTVKGREKDGLMTPATLIMHVENVDMEKYVSYQNSHKQPKLIDIINTLKEKGEWKFSFEIFIAIELNDKDVCMVNTVRQVGVDGTDNSSVTNAMIEGRKMSLQLLGIMRKYFPGFENARIRFISNHIGIRESRRICGRGDAVILDDALSGKRYDDEVIKTTYNFDLPDPERPSFDPLLGSVSNPHTYRKHIGIYAPFSVMLPQGINNLVVSGRCIGVSREVLGPMRVTGPCMMGGQAAGIAAYLAKETSQDVCSICGREIKRIMIEKGVLL